MLILLPPSEGKTAGRRGRALDLDRLSFPALTPTRRAVAAALVEVSARDDAAELLKVSPNLLDEVSRNVHLWRAPSRPAGEVYSGVLYDALDLAGLDAAARRRANRRIAIVTALFGAVRLTDRIVPYRLSMGVNLPGVGPLASAWRPALEEALPAAAGSGVILDCRSSTYAAAWSPQGDLAERWVHVRVPGATHMAKHTRGLVTRHLCESGAAVRRPEQVPEALADRFEVTLTPPVRPGRPWTLDATPR